MRQPDRHVKTDPFAVDGRKMASGWAPLDRFVPYPNNARTHPENEVAALATILKERGFDQPIVVDEAWVILKGHGRLEAAQLAGLKGAPYVQRRGLSEAEKKAIRIEDNALPLLAGWDAKLLRGDLLELKNEGYDLPLLGFSEAQLRVFGVSLGTDGPDPEAVPEPPAVAVTKPGDLWIMGDHRLLCGDSTDGDDVALACGDLNPHLLITDPPYGIDYRPAWRKERIDTKLKLSQDGKKVMKRNFSASGAVYNDDQADWTVVWQICGCDVAYIWHAGLRSSVVQRSLQQAGYLLRAQIIWNKPHFAMAMGDYHWQHECCFYGVRRGARSHWNGDRKQTTVWDINSNVGFTSKTEGKDARTGHGTQKPVECMRRPMVNNTRPGEAVLDPFMGSGTTIIAAEIEKRRAVGLEVDPTYCDLAVRRWETFTGRKAVRAEARAAEGAGTRPAGRRRAPARSPAPSPG
jgi:DNA modification methylase